MHIKELYPDRLEMSVLDMDWEALAKHYQGVIFDIDNTLVPHGAPADEKIIKLLEKIHALGMKTMLVSNNGEERVRPFAEQVNSGFISKAGKPRTGGYKKAMQVMNTDPKHTLFVGDQIFTDIWGANRAGMDTVLMEPVDKSTDEIGGGGGRWLEKPFRRTRA